MQESKFNILIIIWNEGEFSDARLIFLCSTFTLLFLPDLCSSLIYFLGKAEVEAARIVKWN